MVAQHADIWHSFSDLDTFKRKSQILGDWCTEVGTDFAGIERSVGVGDKAPADIGDDYLAAGARLFTTSAGGPDFDLSRTRDWVVWRDAQ